MTPLMAVLGILAISAGGALLADRLRFRRLWSRGCMGRSWIDRFPRASKTEIRDFLDLFVKAFMFRRSERLAFSPSDPVMEIYQTRYPLKSWPDAMELEIFANMARRRYGVDLTSFWHEDITLGEVFEKSTGRAA
jgi:propanediol dehydratase small subunit